jgi:predicted enzyme related to lactoylglutathione lyase
MVIFRVDDLDQLLAALVAAGVRVDPHREEHDYGRFAWIWDPEGNRVELWQP